MAKHSRVFVESGSDLFYLMWAQFETNGDVYMGLTAKGSGGIEQVYDPDLGKVFAKDLVVPQTDEDLRIPFHASGQYKLAGRMGLNQDSPINKNNAPRRGCRRGVADEHAARSRNMAPNAGGL